MKSSCNGCYQNYKGDWWCDNCDTWPCICSELSEEDEVDLIDPEIQAIATALHTRAGDTRGEIAARIHAAVEPLIVARTRQETFRWLAKQDVFAEHRPTFLQLAENARADALTEGQTPTLHNVDPDGDWNSPEDSVYDNVTEENDDMR